MIVLPPCELKSNFCWEDVQKVQANKLRIKTCVQTFERKSDTKTVLSGFWETSRNGKYLDFVAH